MFRLFKLRKSLRRFGKDRKGAAALEFSLVVIPFFMLTFGLAEVSMIGFAQTSLDFAVAETARQIRTGEAQMNNVGESQIKARLCDELGRFIFLTCEGNLYLDVDRFASFVAANAGESPIQDGEFDDSGMGYDPGDASDIVVVRAYYRWEIVTPMFADVFANIDGGQRILASTMMFRNEPFR